MSTSNLESLRSKNTVRWLGLMSGTSCDGIDAAIIECSEQPLGARFIAGGEFAFAPEFSERLLHDLAAVPNIETCARYHKELGDLFAQAAIDAQEQFGDFDAIAISGHTFAHLPREGVTLQLGSAARVAVQLGHPVVADFRSADVARGGEGAPLVPAGDRRLFAHLGAHLVVLNIGGISNFTGLGALDSEPVARDCGPGNLILNQIIRNALIPSGTGGYQQMDIDGQLAAQGRVHEGAMIAWLDHPFLVNQQRSTGREDFGEHWVSSREQEWKSWPLEDRLATCSRFIARCIKLGLQQYLTDTPQRILVGGGGAHNKTLLQDLHEELELLPEILTQQEHGICADLREAAAFAILGHEYLHQREMSFAQTTGIKMPGPIGCTY